MAEPEKDLPPTHDDAIAKLVKTLLNSEVAESSEAHGSTDRDKLRNHMKLRADAAVMNSIGTLSTYLQARAADRQATALESIAKTMASRERTETVDTDAQAIIDLREPKRDYLASTYSLPTETLSLLWAVRGMLMDASVKSLSRPDRLDPYRRLTSEEIAWSLRLSPIEFYGLLPRTLDGTIDFDLLVDFDIVHYAGDDSRPDDWMYGG